MNKKEIIKLFVGMLLAGLFFFLLAMGIIMIKDSAKIPEPKAKETKMLI